MKDNLYFRETTLDTLEKAAKQICSALTSKVVIFRGEMGAGKTTLIKAMCSVWGVQDEVSSPTFALINEYIAQNGKKIYHFDFYRIEREEEAYDMGCEEYFDSGSLCLVEWAEKIPSLVPEAINQITIEKTAPDKRNITLKY